jgi:hypothetical protein
LIPLRDNNLSAIFSTSVSLTWTQVISSGTSQIFTLWVCSTAAVLSFVICLWVTQTWQWTPNWQQSTHMEFQSTSATTSTTE